MTTKPTPLSKEPAMSIGASITAVLIALFAVLRAFGVGVTDDMSSSITALVVALCAVPAVSGFLTRFFVVSPDTARQATETAAQTGVPVDPMQGLDPMQPKTWTV